MAQLVPVETLFFSVGLKCSVQVCLVLSLYSSRTAKSQVQTRSAKPLELSQSEVPER